VTGQSQQPLSGGGGNDHDGRSAVGSSAVLFPGQGSPPRDVAELIRRELPELADLLHDVAGADLFSRPEHSQRRLQLAIFGAMMCGWSRLGEMIRAGDLERAGGIGDPAFAAGHSLGEIAALVAAGSIDIESAVRLVHARGEAMEEALAGPARGAMAALVGPGAHEFAAGLLGGPGLWLANDNSSVQVVVSGTEEAIDDAVERAAAAGMRVVRMPMNGAGHSPLMASSLPRFEAALERTSFDPPSLPVYSGVTARPFTDPRRQLAASVTSTVRFREVLLDLRERGVRTFIDTGPGHTMASLAHKTLTGVVTVTVADIADRLAGGPEVAGRAIAVEGHA